MRRVIILVAGVFVLVAVTTATAYAATPFTKNYQLYDTGAGVKALQQFLNAQGYTVSKSGGGSPGHETTYFGPQTYRAVLRFQKALGVTQSGYFGPLTRAAANKVSTAGGGVTQSATPVPAPTTQEPIQPWVPSNGWSPGFGGGGPASNSGGGGGNTTPADTTAPVLSAIATSSLSTSGITITWTTDETATSKITYGTTASYGTNSVSSTLVTSHTVTLSGLSAGTTYHFAVVSVDASGNTTTSGDYTFTTIPSWVRTGATVDLDLANSQTYGCTSLGSCLSTSRTAGGYAQTSTGSLTWFAADTPRITDLGLLVEEASTNLVKHSQAFESSDWTHNALGDNNFTTKTTAPDGTNTAEKFVENSANAYHEIEQDFSIPATQSRFIFSVYAKAAGRTRISLSIQASDRSSAGTYASYDLSGGQATAGFTFGNGNWSSASAYIEPLGNGWYRCYLVAGREATDVGGVAAIIDLDNGSGVATPNTQYTGNGSSGAYLWGAQLEQATYATSYIPTVTTSATRDADVVTLAGTALTTVNASVGSAVAGINPTSFRKTDATVSLLGAGGSILVGKSSTGGTTQLGGTLSKTTTVPTSTPSTVGLAWNPSGRSLVMNNSGAATDSTAITPSAPVYVGSKGGSTNFLGTYLSRLTFWNSKLSDSSLGTNTPGTYFHDMSALTYYSGNPIMTEGHGTYDAYGIDSPYTNTGDLYVDGTFYAVTQGRQSYTEADWQQLSLYTSTDLLNWTASPSNPVLTQSLGSWDDHLLLHPTIQKIGGIWYMYYSAFESTGTTERVGLATSTDLIHWNKYGPVTPTGYAVPTSIKIGDTYYMYTAVRPSGNTIDYFTSTDGISWTHQGAALTAPIVSDWDYNPQRIEDPFVFKNSKGFYEMVYTEDISSTPYSQKIGYAVSADGITWFRKSDAPIITGSGINGRFDKDFVGDGMLIEKDGTLYIFYVGINGWGGPDTYQVGIKTMPI